MIFTLEPLKTQPWYPYRKFNDPNRLKVATNAENDPKMDPERDPRATQNRCKNDKNRDLGQMGPWSGPGYPQGPYFHRFLVPRDPIFIDFLRFFDDFLTFWGGLAARWRGCRRHLDIYIYIYIYISAARDAFGAFQISGTRV